MSDAAHTAATASPARVEALSDGVFAVALTLLTFDLVAASKMGEGEHGIFRHLLGHWPTLMAYLVGFLTILVCWINHRCVFAFVRRVDSGLLWVNGLQLALVAAVPLPTAILAEHVMTDEAPEALRIYGVATLWTALSLIVASLTVYPALAMWALMFLVFAFPQESAQVIARMTTGRAA